MRERTTVTGEFSNHVSYDAFLNPSGDVYYHQDSYVGEVKTKVIQDIEIPNFRALRKCGAFLPINPCLISTVTVRRVAGSGGFHLYNPDGSVSRYSSGSLWVTLPELVTLPEPDPGLSAAVVTEAAAKASQVTWDVLTFLAEIKESHELVAKTLGNLYEYAFRAARRARRNARPGKSRLKLFADYWLEYRYGWMPLVYDVNDAANALLHERRKGDLIKGKGYRNAPDTVTATHSVNTGTETWYYTDTIEYSYQYRSTCYAEVINPVLATYGFNPVATAWEVVPFSFVVDWFVDVGGWIRSLMPEVAGVSYLGVGASNKLITTRTQTCNIVWDVLANTDGSITGMKTETKAEVYRRTPTGIPPVPHVNVRLNHVRLTDLAALVLGGNRKLARILG